MAKMTPNIHTDMATLVADFKDDYPKFSPLFDDKLIEKAIGMADKYFEPKVWGEYEKYSFYRDGWFAFVAHSLFMAAIADQNVELGNLPGSKRGLDSVTIADETKSYGTQMFLKMSPWDDELASSYYGVLYLHCRDSIDKGLIGHVY
ncbi:DUF4054 domain-containing protein [Vibrio parahaemolyticus]